MKRKAFCQKAGFEELGFLSEETGFEELGFEGLVNTFLIGCIVTDSGINCSHQVLNYHRLAEDLLPCGGNFFDWLFLLHFQNAHLTNHQCEKKRAFSMTNCFQAYLKLQL